MTTRDLLTSAALLFSILVFGASGIAAGETAAADVAIVLEASTSLSQRELHAMRQETSAIWRPYGITVRWLTMLQQGVGDVRVVARLPFSPATLEADAPDRPLGSVLFVEGIPDGVMMIRPEAVEAVILNAGWNGRPLSDVPRALREDLAGRALGRVLAHELGHYLLAQRGHATRGLMRASFKGTELVAVDRRAFRLLSAEVVALGPRVAELAATGRARQIPVRVSSVSLCRAAHFCPACPVCDPRPI